MSTMTSEMTTEQALLLRDFLLSGNSDFATTKKVLAAIPEDRSDYRPDPKARTARELAWHIISSELHFLDSIAQGAQVGGEDLPTENRSLAEMIAFYEIRFTAGLEKIRSLSGEQLAKPIKMYEVFNFPAVSYLTFLQHHTIHHRGQLSVYLRPMDAKVPSIYGPSADETWSSEEAMSA
jgi:uncharacterized damage-inducible protein DinB